MQSMLYVCLGIPYPRNAYVFISLAVYGYFGNGGTSILIVLVAYVGIQYYEAYEWTCITRASHGSSTNALLGQLLLLCGPISGSGGISCRIGA